MRLGSVDSPIDHCSVGSPARCARSRDRGSARSPIDGSGRSHSSTYRSRSGRAPEDRGSAA